MLGPVMISCPLEYFRAEIWLKSQTDPAACGACKAADCIPTLSFSCLEYPSGPSQRMLLLRNSPLDVAKVTDKCPSIHSSPWWQRWGSLKLVFT